MPRSQTRPHQLAALLGLALCLWATDAAAQEGLGIDPDVERERPDKSAPESASDAANDSPDGTSTTLEAHEDWQVDPFPEAGGWTHSALTTVRIVYVPDSILDSFFDRHGSHWDGRANLSFGVDYILRRVDAWELTGGVYWTNMGMPASYWIESGKDLDAADFTRQNLSTVHVEVNMHYNLDIIPEVGWFVGGGAWGGVILGELEKANISRECAEAVERGEGELEGCPTDGLFEKETAIPGGFGMASASTGFRFQLSERVVARLETGFKGYVFGGLSLGGQFW